MELIFTVVSTAAVFEPYKDCTSAGLLLVEWSDGKLTEHKVEFDPFKSLSTPWVKGDSMWVSRTYEWVVEEIREGNWFARHGQAALLRQVKEQKLGWDYQKRGYK